MISIDLAVLGYSINQRLGIKKAHHNILCLPQINNLLQKIIGIVKNKEIQEWKSKF
jgi:hypothetical protein